MAQDSKHRSETPSAQDLADAASKEGRRAADAGRASVKSAKEGVARTVSDATDMARDEADRRVQAATGKAADEVKTHADAADQAAAQYPDGSLPNEALSRVSGFLEDTAQGLRDTDLDQVTREVRRFARRNPVAFVAGAAAIGFAAARLLRASEREEDDGGDPYAADPRDDRDAYDRSPQDTMTGSDLRKQQVAPVGPAVQGRHA